MNIITNKIKLGASAPFKLIHASDTHLTEADSRDTQRKIELAANRSKIFPNALENLEKLSELSKKHSAPIAYTGDMTDFVSYKNLDIAKKFTDENDCLICAGNHEFSLYVGETKEDAAYRNQSLALVQSAFKNDIRFSSRVINGVNLVAIDNSYYRIEPEQLSALEKEVAKKMPIILLMHVPLYNDETYDFIRNTLGHGTGDIMSVPEEKMKDYNAHRYEQQKEDEATHEAYEYILNEPMIKLLLTGHIHEDFETAFGDKIQLLTGTDTARIIEIN